MTKNLTDAEFWWLVGLLEGEGFFDFNNGTQRISLAMTDLDIVEKAAGIFTKITGRVYTIRQHEYENLNHKTRHEFHVFGDGARIVLSMLVPHMGIRRRQRIWQVINGYREPTKRLDINKIVQFHLGNKS